MACVRELTQGDWLLAMALLLSGQWSGTWQAMIHCFISSGPTGCRAAVAMVADMSSMNSRRQNQWQDQVDEALLPHLLVGQSMPIGRLPLARCQCWAVGADSAGRAQLKKLLLRFIAGCRKNTGGGFIASMDARDVKPSRLERIKQKLHDILDESEGSQTALVVYLRCPMWCRR